jgi:hypothetical protein
MRPITRSETPPFASVDEAVADDRAWFEAHPDEDERIREFVPGEFGKAELPPVPDGWRYATHVQVVMRVDGAPDGRARRLMVVLDDMTE